MTESGLHYIDPPRPSGRLVAYEIVGDVTADDLRSLVERVEAIANRGEKALLYQDMVERTSVDLDAIAVKLRNIGMLWRSIEKIAVIGDERWLEIYIGLVDHLTPQHMQYFERADREAAFAWLVEDDA